MSLDERFKKMGMRKVAASIEEIVARAIGEAFSPQKLLDHVATIEEEDRRTRSFGKRVRKSRVGRTASLEDFDWNHPQRIDRALIEQALSLRFVDEGGAVLFFGPVGTGKTRLAKDILLAALAAGHSALFVDAHRLCEDLANQQTSATLERRLRYYLRPRLLCIDELAYQHLDHRRLDLLYEVVRRRYDADRALLVTACLPFAQWPSVMPSTAATAALVDRLVHRALIITIEADSYRRRQAATRSGTP